MSVYAGQYGPVDVFGPSSRLTPGVPVTVYLPGTTTKAVLYTDRTKDTVATNPAVADDLGNFTFYADAGTYDMAYNGKTLTVPAVPDPLEPASFDATSEIVYDDDGNPTSVTEAGITTTFTYDEDGNVVTETRAGLVRTWTYDDLGNPVSSTVEEA